MRSAVLTSELQIVLCTFLYDSRTWQNLQCTIPVLLMFQTTRSAFCSHFLSLPHLLFVCAQLTCGLDACERVWATPFSRCNMAFRSSCWSATSDCSEPFSSWVSGRSNWRMDPISCVNYEKKKETCWYVLAVTFKIVSAALTHEPKY